MRESPIMDIKEVSKFLKLAPRTVREMAMHGEMPCSKIASQWRFERDQIIEWVRQNDAGELMKGPVGKPRILVVDDDKGLLETIVISLLEKLENVIVRGVDSGTKALVEIGMWRPRLVILDLVLPTFDGFEVAKLLRQYPAMKHLSIIAVTGMAGESFERRAYEVGMDAFMQKPLDFENLINIVKTRLRI